MYCFVARTPAYESSDRQPVLTRHDLHQFLAKTDTAQTTSHSGVTHRSRSTRSPREARVPLGATRMTVATLDRTFFAPLGPDPPGHPRAPRTRTGDDQLGALAAAASEGGGGPTNSLSSDHRPLS